jgi:MFS family permease
MKFLSVNFINRTIQILLIFLFVINTGAAFYMPIIAIFITQNIVGATVATVGISAGIYSIVKSIFQIILARRLDAEQGEKDDFFAILVGGLIGVFYSFGFLYVSRVWQLQTLEVIAGIGDACLMAAYYAIFSHHIDKNSQGFEWSLFSVGGLTISTALGGIIGGLVSQTFGFPAVFISAGILNIIGVFIIILLYPHIKILRKSHHYKTVIYEKNNRQL